MEKYLTLYNGEVTIVDEDTYEKYKNYNWYLSTTGYVVRKDEKGNTVTLHREIINAPYDLVVDHINRNKLDNRKENLRICTIRENLLNKAKSNGSYTSHYKGIHWSKVSKSWRVEIKNEGKKVFDGCFSDEIAAVNAYNYYASLYFKEFAYINDIKYMDKSEWEKYQLKIIKTSKYKGVRQDKRSGKWYSYLWHNGKDMFLGSFESEIDAAKAYNQRALELKGENAKINIIK